MILPDQAIAAALTDGEIRIDPPVKISDLRSLGIRVHLAPSLLVPARSGVEIDLDAPTEEEFHKYTMPSDGYLLDSQDYVLGCTRERISTSRHLGCFLDGRSSLARHGLFIHCSSFIIDNVHGEPRVVVLELYNSSRNRLRLRSGMAIGMLAFFRMEDAIYQEASRQYADQQAIIPPRPANAVSRPPR